MAELVDLPAVYLALDRQAGALDSKMFYVYIIYSKKHKRLYIGQSTNVKRRFIEHNKGKVRSTKAYTPYEIIYEEKHETRLVSAFKFAPQIFPVKSKIALVSAGVKGGKPGSPTPPAFSSFSIM